jgi:hypothetical protein
MGRYTFWEKLEPTCHTGYARPHHQARLALQVRPALPGAAAPAPWLVLGPMHLSSPAGTTWMNEIDQGNVGLIEWMRLGSFESMGPLVRPFNRHNRHSKAVLGVPERRWFITRHGVGPAAPPNRHTGRNRPKEPTLNRLRSSDQERPRWEAVDHRAGHTPWSSRTWDIGPLTQPTSLVIWPRRLHHPMRRLLLQPRRLLLQPIWLLLQPKWLLLQVKLHQLHPLMFLMTKYS